MDQDHLDRLPAVERLKSQKRRYTAEANERDWERERERKREGGRERKMVLVLCHPIETGQVTQIL